jgi:phage gp16-like protein
MIVLNRSTKIKGVVTIIRASTSQKHRHTIHAQPRITHIESSDKKETGEDNILIALWSSMGGSSRAAFLFVIVKSIKLTTSLQFVRGQMRLM